MCRLQWRLGEAVLSLTTYHLLLTTVARRRSTLTTYHLPLTTDYLLLTTYRVPTTVARSRIVALGASSLASSERKEAEEPSCQNEGGSLCAGKAGGVWA